MTIDIVKGDHYILSHCSLNLHYLLNLRETVFILLFVSHHLGSLL